MALKYDLVVIGGGAAGMAAAVSAAAERTGRAQNCKVALLEANPRVGKKLLATGNGRCNLTNLQASPQRYHGDADQISSILRAFSPRFIMEYFGSLGLLCREQDEGRVYPYSMQAASVLDMFRTQLERLMVEVICDFPVHAVRKTSSGFLINGPGREVEAKTLIVASGGMAYPQLGANESGYSVLRSLGHSCTALFPALVQLKTEPRRAKPLKGARSAAKATLLVNEKRVKTVTGEVQFTENGLSGICIFELSRLVGEHAGASIEVSLDLMPDFTEQDVLTFLKQRQASAPILPAAELLNGCLNRLVGQEIMKQCPGAAGKTIGGMKERELSLAVKAVKQFRFPVTGTLSWRDAQVTAGGIPLAETDSEMQSTVCPGLYLAGEVLNIDGDCGGFNLHWAWSTGILAGRSAARALNHEKR